MEVLDSFVEWFNGLLGLQYAGYGPITAILIGIGIVAISLRVLKFFLKPFAPLFQTAQELGEANPVLERKGVRQAHLPDAFEEETALIFDRPSQAAGRGTTPSLRSAPVRDTHLMASSRFDELCSMDLDDDSRVAETREAVLASAHETDEAEDVAAALADFRDRIPALAEDPVEDEFPKPIKDFSSALEAALEEDSTAPRAPARFDRQRPKLSLVSSRPDLGDVLNGDTAAKPPATASAALASLKTPQPSQMPRPAARDEMPLVQVFNFGDTDKPACAANRLALRLGEGVTETLARIPNLAVEKAATTEPLLAEVPGFGTRFVVEGGIEVEKDGVKAAIKVKNGTDGSEVLSRDMMCKPSELQKFEKEVALEIAAAVIAHQKSSGAPVTHHLQDRKAAQSGSKYPSARRPLPERLRRTDLPVQ